MKSTFPQQAEQMNQSTEDEKEVVILLSDMVGYSRKTTDMRPTAIKNFMLEYHMNLKTIIQSVCHRTNCLRLSGNVGTGSKSLTPKLWDLPVHRFGGPTDFVLLARPTA